MDFRVTQQVARDFVDCVYGCAQNLLVLVALPFFILGLGNSEILRQRMMDLLAAS